MGRRCGTLLLLLACGCTAAAAPTPDTADCVRAARDQAAIVACEQRAQGVAQARIDQRVRWLKAHLAPRDAGLVDRVQAQWQAYLASELRLLERTAQSRADDMGGVLRAGAHTQLLEERAALLEHQVVNLGHRAPPASE